MFESTTEGKAFDCRWEEVAAPRRVVIEQMLVRARSRTVLMTVSGHGMRDAGILDGDIVVVEKRSHAGDGDIVVALANGTPVLRLLELKNDAWCVRATGPDVGDAVPSDRRDLFGLVVGVIRAYGR